MKRTSGIGVEGVLGAVAVVDVPVDDQDALDAVGSLGVAGGDDDVVEDAEAHAEVGDGMVAGRADVGEDPRRPAGDGGIDRGHAGAGGQQGDLVRVGRDRRALTGIAAASRAKGFDPSDVLAGVIHRQVIDGGRVCLDADELLSQPGEIDQVLGPHHQAVIGHVHDGIDEGERAVARPDRLQSRVVLQEAVVKDEANRGTIQGRFGRRHRERNSFIDGHPCRAVSLPSARTLRFGKVAVNRGRIGHIGCHDWTGYVTYN